jgi:ABC-type glycerol-3-phosphate transport system permease component
MVTDFHQWFIAGAGNLAVIMIVYSAMSYYLARLAWGRGGIAAVILLIIASQLFWIPLTIMTAPISEFPDTASYSPWFGNWLVTGFAIVLLQRKARSIPKSLNDAGQLDGLGAFHAWRRIVLPFIGSDLIRLAVFSTVASVMSAWVLVHTRGSNTAIIVPYLSLPLSDFVRMTGASLLGAVGLLGFFFGERRHE